MTELYAVGWTAVLVLVCWALYMVWLQVRP